VGLLFPRADHPIAIEFPGYPVVRLRPIEGLEFVEETVGCADDDAALQSGCVDKGSHRRLCQKTRNPTDRHDDADAGGFPFLHSEQTDREVGTKPIADIGEAEVHPVERCARSNTSPNRLS
jgi:hypothetical protein